MTRMQVFHKESRGVKYESKRKHEREYENNVDQNPTKTINKLKYNIPYAPRWTGEASLIYAEQGWCPGKSNALAKRTKSEPYFSYNWTWEDYERID